MVKEENGPWLVLVVKLINHIRKMCHEMSISGGCVCYTKNSIISLAYLPSPYLAAMMHYNKLTQKQSILLILTWEVGIGKY